ncbi:MAG: VOC family protein [Pyrinomonadaceae bacterium]|nr:VOC family protein [Acidobacteriota bacterium]MBK7932794.1 VOC family protein [Acidobacteriota bacterium]MBP7374993.1 VOC family protein [Pyrinomonadaceae bacterium]MBP7474788.1 VOC family protein [Pyrinomonadaceae bacterium]
MKTHFILYVADQARSTAFYSAVLETEPTLNVPGMTEFSLSEGTVIGLMPEAGAVRLFGDEVTPPVAAGLSPRAEIYLVVKSAEAFHSRAIKNGAREISGIKVRDWGHTAAYSIDPDGYVIAFAEPTI